MYTKQRMKALILLATTAATIAADKDQSQPLLSASSDKSHQRDVSYYSFNYDPKNPQAELINSASSSSGVLLPGKVLRKLGVSTPKNKKEGKS